MILMKLASYRGLRFGLVTLLTIGGVALVSAQSADRPRGNAIILSGPKSDIVSSNLNELRAPASPFREMESSLKKPFELFEPSKPGQGSYPALRTMSPPAPEMKRKSQKELLNQRAEEMFLESGLHPGETDDDLFKSGDSQDSADPLARKPKTTLDRYYDRMDRAMTNRASGTDTLGSNRDSQNLLNPNNSNPFADRATLDSQRNPAGNRLRPLSTANDFKRDSVFGDRNFGSQSDSSLLNKSDSYYPSYREQKVDRLDAFKQLLEGPGAPPRSGSPLPGGNYGSSPARSGGVAPALSGFNSKPANNGLPVNSFAKSAGLVGAPGTPQGLPDYTASTKSLHPDPTTQSTKPPTAPTFNIPKRRF